MKKMNFANAESLKSVIRVLCDASAALNETGYLTAGIKPHELAHTLKTSAGTAVGAVGGAVVSGAAIYALGVPGFSAAGIASGLAAIGGGMLGGVVIAALPPVLLALAGSKYVSDKNLRKYKTELKARTEELLSRTDDALSRSAILPDSRRKLSECRVLLSRCVQELKEDLEGQGK